MISSITIENFKSFERATLPLAPLTILTGATASGKSNFIEGIRLLAWLASGKDPEETLFAVAEEGLEVRGSLDDYFFRGDTFSLGCETGPPNPSSFEVTLERGGNGFRITAERFNRDQVPGALLTPTKESRSRALPRSLLSLRRELENIFILAPDSSQMRLSSLPGRFDREGMGLPSVLRLLVEKKRQKEEVLGFLRALPGLEVCDLSFRDDYSGAVLLLHERLGGGCRLCEAWSLSEGTLHTLGIATAMLSVQKGSVVILDRIVVHPSGAEAILENIQRVARQRGLRVVFATHVDAPLGN